MIAPALCALVSIGVLALYRYCDPQRISPDGKIYLLAGAGAAVPRPFHLRPLAPLLCGTSVESWKALSASSLMVAAVTVGALAELRGANPLAASALFVGLPIVRTTMALPVLVDGPALACTALSVLFVGAGHPFAGAALAAVGAGFKEHVPVFAALASWSLWPLAGLLVTVAIWLARTPADTEHPSQSTPVTYAREKQAPRLLDATKMLLPWGACLAAGLALTPAVAVSLAVAYGLLFISADSTRIYQWAAIPVCVAAASVIPDSWLPLAVAAHVLNPWRGDV